MTAWTSDELTKIGAADELQIAARPSAASQVTGTTVVACGL